MWAKLVEFHPTTVHGISRLFKHSFCSFKMFLLTVWLALCIAFCFYEFTNTFKSFLAFGVKTTKTLVPVGAEGIDFPAITFCSTSVARRSVMGIAPYVRQTQILIATRITNQTELDQISQSCVQNASDSEVASVNDAFIHTTGIGARGIEFFKRTQIDSLSSAVNCKWKNNEIDCGTIFINKFTDGGFCFTFNPALDLLKTYELATVDAIKTNHSEIIKTYGMASSDWQIYVSQHTGPKSGFSIVLLSNTTEYCAPVLGYGGFVATVHDPMAEPLTWSKNGINLGPGWQTNVAMSLTKTDRRKTKSLGYCKSQLDLLTYKNVVDYTSRDFFIIDCAVKKIIAKCQCSPYYSPRGFIYYYSDFPTLFSGSNYSKPDIEMCGDTAINAATQVTCLNSVEKKVLRSDSECFLNAPKPCEETQISTKTTASRWPNDALLPHLKRLINGTADMSLEQFHQNFISANFFFNEYRYTLVTESLKMTWVDLMNQMGGAIGMTLGLSIVGVVELFIWILTRPLVVIHTYNSNASKDEILYRVSEYRP